MIFRVSSVHVLGSSFMFIDYRSSFRFHCLAQNRSLHLIQGLVKLPKLTSSKRLENLTRFGLVQLMSRYEQKKTFLDSQQLVFRRHSLPTKYPLAAQTHLRQHLIIIHIKHRKNCECCPHHSLFKGHNVIVNIVVLNC